jgi:hypothetical protein
MSSQTVISAEGVSLHRLGTYSLTGHGEPLGHLNRNSKTRAQSSGLTARCMGRTILNVYADVALKASVLARAHKWQELRVFFSYWDDEDEQAAKCVAWMRFFLPDMFQDETPEFQYDLVKRLLSRSNQFIAIPRGFSKTSSAQGVLCFIAVNALRNFCVIIEKSFTEAVSVLSVIRETFADNARVLQVYGALLTKDDAGGDPTFAKDTQGDILVNGVRFRAKGFQTPIRGLKSGPHRPDFALLDDCEEDTHIRNEEQRRKYRENFYSGIIPALAIDGSVKVIGTILHNDSLLKGLIDQHGGLLLRAFDPADPERTLLWPTRWTYERLMERKAQMESEGLGSSAFAKEYLNQPTDDDSRLFRYEWLQRKFADALLSGKLLNRFVSIDVADAKGEGHDFTFVTVVDVDVENNWYVQYAKQKRVDAKELIDWIFELWNVWKPLKIGVEKNAFEHQVTPFLKERSIETGVFPVCEELKDGGRMKLARVVGALQGRLASGKIYFRDQARDDTGVLIGQLYDFPRGKFDDGCDALAYIASIASRPFAPQPAPKFKTLEQEMQEHRRRGSKSLASRL